MESAPRDGVVALLRETMKKTALLQGAEMKARRLIVSVFVAWSSLVPAVHLKKGGSGMLIMLIKMWNVDLVATERGWVALSCILEHPTKGFWMMKAIWRLTRLEVLGFCSWGWFDLRLKCRKPMKTTIKKLNMLRHMSSSSCFGKAPVEQKQQKKLNTSRYLGYLKTSRWTPDI